MIHGIEKNFQKVDIHYANEDLIVIKDNRMMVVSDLVSTVASLLNLYSVITFIILVDILYVFIKVVCYFCCCMQSVEKDEKETRAFKANHTKLI